MKRGGGGRDRKILQNDGLDKRELRENNQLVIFSGLVIGVVYFDYT